MLEKTEREIQNEQSRDTFGTEDTGYVRFMVFNTTFNNISVIWWCKTQDEDKQT